MTAKNKNAIKAQVIQYLNKKGYKDFTVKRSGDFIHVSLWDIITFKEYGKIEADLENIVGTLSGRFSWMNALKFRAGNVRFVK